MGDKLGEHLGAVQRMVARELRHLPPQVAEDAVQEVLEIAVRRLGEQQPTALRGWLFGITTRVCANVRRRHRRAFVSADDVPLAAHGGESAYQKLRRAERDAVLLEAIGRHLDADEQDVVYMRYALDLPYEEIARLAGLVGAEEVRVVLQRCRRRLERGLTEALEARGHGTSLNYVTHSSG